MAVFDRPMAEPSPDGRTGRVAAGCVFWMESVDSTFSTVAEDHGNCSVGSWTHGFKPLEEIAGNGDVGALLESGWVTMDMVPHIPVVTEKPGAVTYGPLADTPIDPDVVLVRLTAKSLMVLSDALPGLRVEGKPQCHIVAAAKEQNDVVASVGCALSRVRTGMPSTDHTCAIPRRPSGRGCRRGAANRRHRRRRGSLRGRGRQALLTVPPRARRWLPRSCWRCWPPSSVCSATTATATTVSTPGSST